MDDPLAERASTNPDAPAVDTGAATFTFAELDERVDEIARRLAGAGLRPGRAVATLLPNGVETAVGLHAIPRTGATLAPLHTGRTERELVEHLDLVRPSVVLCSRATEQLASLVTQSANLVSLDQPTSKRALHVEDLPRVDDPLPGPGACAPHSIVATSGTSGQPQAAAFDLQAHVTHAHATAKRLDLALDDRWLGVLNPAHIGGLALWLRATVLASCVVPLPGFDAGHIAQVIEEAGITHASLVPVMLEGLLDARDQAGAPEALQAVLLGGAACSPALLKRAVGAGWPIALTYGLTEAGSQVCTAPPELTRAKPGTVGEPLEGVEVRVAEDGEVLVRSPAAMQAYLGSEESPIEDGWLHTGDAGRIDDEGHLWITGRLSARIVSGGVTVDPVEVEDVLSRHPGVHAVCVVGVEHERWGERVSAAIVPTGGADLEPDQLTSWCREDLSGPKLPRAFVFVDALPRNANGKVDRDRVRALFGT